jgi:Flp pilus assembly protein TadG
MLRYRIHKRVARRGFVLLFIAIVLAVMLAMLGLAVDMGRMFIVKDELQTFADAAAMGADAQLDGTQAGLDLANTTATQGPLGATTPNAWLFDTRRIANVAAGYATSFTGTYDDYATASAPPVNSYRFVKVTAQATLPLYFLPVVPGISTQQPISAFAIAGQKPQATAGNGGLAPFTPAAHNAADAKNFGLIPGGQYTLKWGNGNTTTCTGDQGFNDNGAPSAHGFVDLGQGKANSNLRFAIVYGGYPNPNSTPSSVGVGSVLNQVPGNRGTSIFRAMAERSAQDPDQSSITWAQYLAAGIGNGRRVVTAPIHDPALNAGNGANFHYTMIGFGNFLIDTANTISGTSGPICATYIGPASSSGGSSGGSDGTRIYSTTLYQ